MLVRDRIDGMEMKRVSRICLRRIDMVRKWEEWDQIKFVGRGRYGGY